MGKMAASYMSTEVPVRFIMFTIHIRKIVNFTNTIRSAVS